jgi:DNA-binding NarL/FixJ family response regulator
LGVSKSTGFINVVIVDDNEIVRQGVRKLLSRDTRIRVVGEAVSSDEAILLISELQPDVALTDIRLEHGTGIDVSRAARNVAPNTRVLFLSAYDDDQYVRSAMKLGVSGYLLKTASAKELTRAIHDAVDGHLVFSPLISDKVKILLQKAGSEDCSEVSTGTRRNEKNGKETTNMLSGDANLTGREVEVLEHIALGLRNSEIASAMGISSKTVEAHVDHILMKLGARSRIQAVLWGLQSGLLRGIPQ